MLCVYINIFSLYTQYIGYTQGIDKISILYVLQYTISGKKVEIAVRDTIAGKPVTHRAAFTNPESLNLYVDIPELQGY